MESTFIGTMLAGLGLWNVPYHFAPVELEQRTENLISPPFAKERPS